VPPVLTTIYPATAKHAIIKRSALCSLLPSPNFMPHMTSPPPQREKKSRHAMKTMQKETSPEAATHFLPPELNAGVSSHVHDA